MSYIEELYAKWESNLNAMKEKDRNARQADELKGRYIQKATAAGYAFYEIVKVNKKSVRIQLVEDIGDDLMDYSWGEAATIPLSFAMDNVRARDRWEDYNQTGNKKAAAQA